MTHFSGSATAASTVIVARTGFLHKYAQKWADSQYFSVLRGTGPAILDLSKLLRMSLSMKSNLYAQLHPVKTMKHLVNDRCVYRLLILGMILVNWCS
jgi:hypothetical protein